MSLKTNEFLACFTFQIKTTLGSANFLKDRTLLLRAKFSIGPASLRSPSMLRDILQALVVRLLNFVSSRHSSSFEKRNGNQFHSARTLAIAFAETVAFSRFVESISDYPSDQVIGPYDHTFKVHLPLKSKSFGLSSTIHRLKGGQLQKNVMETIAVLFGLKTLTVHVGHLHEYSIFSDPHHSRYTMKISYSHLPNSLNLISCRALYDLVPIVCRELMPNALALVDAVAPPDFVLNSAIGHSSGRIYDQLKKTFYRSPDTFERAPHWREIVSMLNKSKL